jgi:YVTN family beta-propeller protein
VVDTATPPVIKRFRFVRRECEADGRRYRARRRRVYVANGRGNTVSVVDAKSHEVVRTISVGQRVWGLALTPDGRKLYAANSLSNDVSVIDTATDEVVATVEAGDGP